MHDLGARFRFPGVLRSFFDWKLNTYEKKDAKPSAPTANPSNRLKGLFFCLFALRQSRCPNDRPSVLALRRLIRLGCLKPYCAIPRSLVLLQEKAVFFL